MINDKDDNLKGQTMISMTIFKQTSATNTPFVKVAHIPAEPVDPMHLFNEFVSPLQGFGFSMTPFHVYNAKLSLAF